MPLNIEIAMGTTTLHSLFPFASSASHRITYKKTK